jgi:hypothetical protein
VLAGRPTNGDEVVAAALVMLRRDKAVGVDSGRFLAQANFDPGQTRPYQPPTLRPFSAIDDKTPASRDSDCPSQHPTNACR